ncbi:AraC family transcriptional regulator ligand-binding domain-containing protein [Sphingobium chlorophenolicum]|uniref:Helix-turn-helix, AraC domain protein n=1 Tax=Sphingobium chlorophenolicum TaxID=46429 RepID=A0A081REB2_SPHCR|nr:AraC family transcriptional regulator ligand-binding domain-containing protein [Sphingobium chlorophenolicum]KEQ53535.1 Helix-turn-helix, AraC domain protein [Sphingobium chlorophenolicum]
MADADADAGALRQFISFARTTGLNLDAILDAELRAIAAAAPHAERVPAHAIVDMLQICSAVARRPDLGVSFAQWGNIRGYGPLSLLWDHCPTMADAIRVNARYGDLESRALASSLEEEAGEVAIRHVLLVPARYGGSQFIESILLLSTRLGRQILGESWCPLRVEFQHSAPSDYRIHRRLFRCPLEFGAERSAVVVSREDIHRPTPHGNAHLLAFLEQHLETVRRSMPVDFVGQVDQLIAANLASGEATMTHIAMLLRVSRRTLQRGLEQNGTNFSERLEAARRRVVEDYFRTERRPNLTLLAYRLGYSDASAASRFLRQHMNAGVRQFVRHETEKDAEGVPHP